MTGINLSAIGLALLHPTQKKILEYMAAWTAPSEGVGKEKPLKGVSPNELSRAIDESLGNVSYHVSCLAGGTRGREGTGKSRFAEAPMLELVDTRQRRGALEHYYGLTAAAKAAPAKEAVPA